VATPRDGEHAPAGQCRGGLAEFGVDIAERLGADVMGGGRVVRRGLAQDRPRAVCGRRGRPGLATTSSRTRIVCGSGEVGSQGKITC
jgi:hypothetical protein